MAANSIGYDLFCFNGVSPRTSGYTNKNVIIKIHKCQKNKNVIKTHLCRTLRPRDMYFSVSWRIEEIFCDDRSVNSVTVSREFPTEAQH